MALIDYLTNGCSTESTENYRRLHYLEMVQGSPSGTFHSEEGKCESERRLHIFSTASKARTPPRLPLCPLGGATRTHLTKGAVNQRPQSCRCPHVSSNQTRALKAGVNTTVSGAGGFGGPRTMTAWCSPGGSTGEYFIRAWAEVCANENTYIYP